MQETAKAPDQPEPEASPKTTSRRWLILRILGMCFSLGLLVYLIHSQGWNDFADVFKRLPPAAFAIAVGLMLGSRICVTLRWMVLLHYARVKMSFWQAFRLMFMGNFASNFLPSTVGGDLVRLAGSVTLGVDAGVSAASLLLDRLVGMAGMASLGPYGLFLISRQAGSSTVLPGPIYALGLIAGIRRVPALGWVYNKLEKFIRSLVASSLNWIKHPLSLLFALFCNYGHMLFTFAIIWVLLNAMGEKISFLWIGALWSLSYFVSLMPVSINGFGLQEVSITMLYSQFGGVSMQSALALAILMRTLQLLATLPGVLFLPEILRPIPKTPPSGSNPSVP